MESVSSGITATTPDKNSYEELKDVAGPDIVMYPACDESNPSETEYSGYVYEAYLAVDSGIPAELIKAGTSGSYYIRDRNKVRELFALYFEATLICRFQLVFGLLFPFGN